MVFELAKSHSCDNTLELILCNRFLFLDWVNFNSFVPAACDDEFIINWDGDTGDGSGMSLIPKKKLKIIVENGKFPVFGTWHKVLSRRWELHRIDSVSVIWNYLVDLPGMSVPNDNAWCFLIKSVATSGHKLAVVTSAHIFQLMRMSIQFVHFRPKCMLDQVIVMRRNAKINFLRLLEVNLFLLNIFSLLIFFIVVIDNFFPLNSLHFGHQSQHLLTTFSVGLVK